MEAQDRLSRSNLGLVRPEPVVKAIQDYGASDRVTELFWFCSYCPSRSILGVGR